MKVSEGEGGWLDMSSFHLTSDDPNMTQLTLPSGEEAQRFLKPRVGVEHPEGHGEPKSYSPAN